MNPALTAVAIVAVAGAVVAVSAREGRVAVLGLVLALVVSPLVALPVPDVLSLAIRMVAGVLAAYLLWAVLRGPSRRTAGSRLGWPVEALVALVAAAVGVAGLPGGAGGGSPEATGAGLAIAALALAPLRRADAVQLAVGASLAVVAAVLLRSGLAGAPSPLEQIAVGGLTVAVAGATAALAAVAIRRAETVELDVRPTDGAHRSPGSDEEGPRARPARGRLVLPRVRVRA